MTQDLKPFAQSYLKHLKDREGMGIPPLPLTAPELEAVIHGLKNKVGDEDLLKVHDQPNTTESLFHLLAHRTPPGVYPASKKKAAFLGDLLKGEESSKRISQEEALKLLSSMGGGSNVAPLIEALSLDGMGEMAKHALENIILISSEDFQAICASAEKGNQNAGNLLISWAEAKWFSNRKPVESVQQRMAIRMTGEINTDFLSPAQEASTRDDIPLHALKMLSTSPEDTDFLERLKDLSKEGLPFLPVGDVVGTGSSRKSASNSLVWWIGEEIPYVPNKKRGGVLLASKIAPIFFNTMRGCGAIPVRCSTGNIKEGTRVTLDFNEGVVKDDSGTALTSFQVTPFSIMDEARAGGRNNLIIGRQLTRKARSYCETAGLKTGDPALELTDPVQHPGDKKFSLAQKLVGAACEKNGVVPGEYCEPKAHMVFSQDTTGKMTQQELQELACLKFESPTIQSFCHTAAGPKSKDSTMQFELGAFVQELGGIDLRPGDGVIHTNGNRFLLPYFVGTGGDSHTRFPIGLSFPAGSDLVAFAASQGYFPLDMPESVLAKFTGKAQVGITIRDIVNSIPYAALKTGQLNLDKGDAKTNVFADRVLEMVGLEEMSVMGAYKLTDTSAERSAAGSTFNFKPEQVKFYVENNLKFLKNNFAQRHPAPVVKTLIALFEEWLKNPEYFTPDEGAEYADTVHINLDEIKEPLLAAPNDPDKIVTLSEAAKTPIDEVFVGSCMTDIADFRAVAAILDGKRLPHKMKMWTTPPDRETYSQLANEGVLTSLMESGANVHVPGCSLCMGNQAQVATNCTTLSTSTRNFNNRMGVGAQVFLGSAHLGAVTALLNRLPTLDEYLEIYKEKVLPKEEEIMKPLEF